MILQPQEIVELIRHPKNGDLIKRAKEILISHRLHIKGIGLEEFLVQIQGLEDQAKIELRRRVAKPMTVPLMAKELGVKKKVFCAQGGSRYYDIAGEGLVADFKQYLGGDVGDGHTMYQLMAEQWNDKVDFDCSGVFMVELPVKQTSTRPEPYVTFRSVCDMHDVGYTGRKIEYIIFMRVVMAGPTNQEEYTEYRVVDDAFDYIYRRKADKIELVKDLTLVNPWGYVPATFISDQKDACSEAKTSYFWEAIPIADEYMADASIHTINKYLHGYPVYWEIERGCVPCQGKGHTGKDTAGKLLPCQACSGTGKRIKKDVSDKIVVPARQSNDEPDNTNVAGYIQPELATLASQNEELDRLATLLHLACWGNKEGRAGQTEADSATGVIYDIQAQYDKLNMISDNAQAVEQFLVDTIGKIRYGTLYRGSLINYGRRYFIRNEYELEELYKKAKENGLPYNLLANYREELMYVRYSRDPEMLDRAVKLNQLEPFPDLTIAELQDLSTVSPADITMKVYFNQYIARYEAEKKSVFLSTVEEIRVQLELYNQEKLKQLEAQRPKEEPVKEEVIEK